MERQPPPGPTRRSGSRRSSLNSPLLAVGLAVLAVGLIASILLIPGLFPAASPTPSAPCPAGCPPHPTPSQSGGLPPSASPSTGPVPTFVRPTPTPEPTFISYTVKAGESLNTIAHKFGTTARSIAWWNRGTYPSLDPESPNYAPNNIQLGWVLVLIPGAKVDDNNPPTPSPGRPTPTPGPATAAPSPGPS